MASSRRFDTPRLAASATSTHDQPSTFVNTVEVKERDRQHNAGRTEIGQEDRLAAQRVLDRLEGQHAEAPLQIGLLLTLVHKIFDHIGEELQGPMQRQGVFDLGGDVRVFQLSFFLFDVFVASP